MILVYEFVIGTRAVYIQAENPQHANVKFQERFGYWPTDANVPQ